MTPVRSRPQFSSLPSRIRTRTASTTPTLSSRDSQTFSTRTIPVRGDYNIGTYQRHVRSMESLPVVVINPTPSFSSLPTKGVNDDKSFLGPAASGHERTVSSKSSYDSSVCATTTIHIKPSRGLQAMQSVGSDTGHVDITGARRRSNRYLTQSQLSLTIPEVYIPTGLPQYLVDELDTTKRTSWTTHTSRSSAFEAFLDHEIADTNQPESWTEPTTTPYGPSDQDIQDLIERQEKWDEEQKRRPWRPLQRFASLGKEITGGLVRTLSKGPSKKAFEARAKQTRTASHLQSGETAKRASVLRRHHTIGVAHGYRRLRSEEFDGAAWEDEGEGMAE
jgi:hypothetical protein